MRGPLRTFRVLWDLTWLRIRRDWQVAQSNDRAVVRVLLTAAVSLVMAVLLYGLARSMFLLVAADRDAIGLLTSAPEGVLAIFLALGGGLGFMLGVSHANDALYLRSDLDWLMGLPLDRRGVVLARAGEIFLSVLGPVAVLSFPATLAYARSCGAWYSLAAYPLVLVSISAFVSTAAMLAMTLVGRLASTARAREALGLFGSVLGALLYLLLLLRKPTAPANLVDSLAEGLVKILDRPGTAVAAAVALPVVWPALAMRFITSGPVSTGLAIAVTGIAATAGAVWLLSIAAAGAYARGLGLSSAGRRRSRPRRTAPARTAAAASGASPGRAGVLPALIRRDWAILTRSPRLWQPMTMPLVWVIYILAIRPAGLGGADSLVRAALAALMPAIAGSTLSTMSLGVEGNSFYHLSTLPVSPHSRVTSKVLVFALPPALIGLVVVGVLFREAGTALDLLRAVLLVVTAAVTMTAVGLMTTAPDTNFEAVNPGQWQSGSAGCLSMLLTGLIVAMAFLLLTASRGLGRWLGVARSVSDTLGVVVLAIVCLGVIVPGAMRTAAAAVRARARGEVPPSLNLNWGP